VRPHIRPLPRQKPNEIKHLADFLKRLASFAGIALALFVMFGVIANVARLLEYLFPLLALAAGLYFLGSLAVDTVRERLRPPAPPEPPSAPAPSENPWTNSPPSQARVMEFLMEQDEHLRHAFFSLPEQERAQLLERGGAAVREIDAIDRWIEEVKKWPQHQRDSVEAQAVHKVERRVQVLLAFAEDVLATRKRAAAQADSTGG
jgi:hypothetical protein